MDTLISRRLQRDRLSKIIILSCREALRRTREGSGCVTAAVQAQPCYAVELGT